MGRASLGALIGIAAVSGVLAIGLADCAEPTQIQIDVRSDACGVLKNAGIAVATPERIDSTKLAIFTPERADDNGCEASPKDRVGTLIIYPSGSKDAEVGIRVVGGISRTAEECDRTGDYAGCVVARRIERFSEGSTKKVIIILSRACEGKDCGLGKECSPSGACVVNLADGGTEDAGVLDAQTPPDGSVDGPTDAPPDGIVDAGTDACSGCAGQCTNGTQCLINCNAGANCTGPVCGPGLDCQINCNAGSSCSNVSCAAGARSCTFDCLANPSCNNVSCVAPSCLVKCSNTGRCAGNITLGTGDAGLLCNGNQSCDNVNAVSCTGATCLLSCPNGSCPNTKTCDASTCTGPWN